MITKEYKEYEALNASKLKTVLKKPWDLFHEEKPSTKAMEMGNLFEIACEAIAFKNEDIIENNVRIIDTTTRTTKAFKEVETDKLKVLRKEWDQCLLMANKALTSKYNDTPLMEYYINSKIELFLKWETLDIKKKACLDFVVNATIDGVETVIPFDFKTYQSSFSSYFDFKRQIYDFGYWIQAVHYFEGLKMCYQDKNIHQLTLVAVDKVYPHFVSYHTFTEELIEELVPYYNQLIDKYLSIISRRNTVNQYLSEDLTKENFYFSKIENDLIKLNNLVNK